MIITGSITNAGPASPPEGQYGVRYQDVVITSNEGYEYTGRIGSKNGYANGTPIQVTSEEKQGSNGTYLYFKKYNPQYPQGGNQQSPPPQQRPPQQQAPQQPQGPNKDVIIVRQCCIKAAVVLHQANTSTEAIAAAQQFEDYVFGRTAPMEPQNMPDECPI
jgi:hypothetical protein